MRRYLEFILLIRKYYMDFFNLFGIKQDIEKLQMFYFILEVAKVMVKFIIYFSFVIYILYLGMFSMYLDEIYLRNGNYICYELIRIG